MKKFYFSLMLLSVALISSVSLSAQDIVVDQDGSGDYTTVQEAFDAVPSNSSTRTVIYIKNGTYYERLTLDSDKINVTIIGESVSGVVLYYDNYASKVNSETGETFGTSGSASTYIYADGFYAWNITFENSAGAVGQALAIYISGDKAVFKNCYFLGWQDTMYGGECRQYFEDCYIEGSTDFIFGPSTAFFENCDIYSKGGTAITAASTESYVDYGYVFNNCSVTGASGVSTYLGRTWRPYAATCFMNSSLSSCIRDEGWSDWDDEDNQSTARYSEYNNSGDGASTSDRVSWSSVLSSSEAANYTAENILKTTYDESPSTDNWSPFDVIDNTSAIGSSVTNSSIDGTYSILAVHSGMALDTYAWGTTDGTNICQWTYWGGECQQFIIEPVSGIWHRITPVIATDQAMDVYGISTESGANINTWEYWGGYGQQFRFQVAGSGKWRIINRNSELCFDVDGASTDDGANVQQWTCTANSTWQQFNLVSVSDAQEAVSSIKEGMQVYPNPLTGNELSVRLSLENQSDVEISVFNSIGQKVYTQTFAQQSSGANELSVSLPELVAGTYIVSVKSGNKIMNDKILIN